MKLTEGELRAIINSDMKLWERASTSPHEKGIAKTFDLPYGIGVRTVVFPEASRGAVEQFGPIVRGWVDEVKGEAAAERGRLERLAKEARAEATGEVSDRAAEGVQSESGDTVSEGALSTSAEEAVSASIQAVADSTGLSDRRAALVTAIDLLEARIFNDRRSLKSLEKEYRAINAALEIMNAPDDDAEESGDILTEVEVEKP